MIQYDDGDKERVGPGRLRPLAGGTGTIATYRVGQQVTGNYRGDGRWYPGRITRRNSRCSYNIRYNDGDTDNDMHPIFIRSAAVRTSCTIRTGTNIVGNWRSMGRWYRGRVTGCSAASGYAVLYADNSRETGVPAARVRALPSSACRYRVGQNLQGNWLSRGRYYRGRITAAAAGRGGNACRYTVAYTDGSRESNVVQFNLRA